MKYKTLFRLLLKLFGIVLLGEALPYVGFGVVDLLPGWRLGSAGAAGMQYSFTNLVTGSMMFGASLYLFFGGKWVADLAIPGNRPYCPECGYDLTGATEWRCPECGTAFSSKDISPPGAK